MPVSTECAAALLFFRYPSLLLFFCWLVRFFPWHQIFQQKQIHSSYQAFLISSCNLILFSNENCLFHMEHFSLLNLLFCKFPFTLMVPKINTMHQVLIFLDCQGHVWQIKFSCINTGSRDGGNLHNYVRKQHNSQ